MAINEVDILLQRKDSEGNIEINYPLTTAENVAGLENKLQNYVHKSLRNQRLGYAGLDEEGKIPGQLLSEEVGKTALIRENITDEIREHNEDLQAHPYLYNKLSALESRLAELELLFNGGSDSFSVSFEDIDDVSVSGVWNKTLKRIEF